MGDDISILVSGDFVDYRHNGVSFYRGAFDTSSDPYIDTACRGKSVSMEVSIVQCETPECLSN